LVAGCNRPAKLRAEQNVEVVRNGEDGTNRFDGIGRSKVSGGRKHERYWEWTHGVDADGGVVLWTSSREELGGFRAGPERVMHRKSWAAFTPMCLRGRDKGQCDTFGWRTEEGRAAWRNGCLQPARDEARGIRKFLGDQAD